MPYINLTDADDNLTHNVSIGQPIKITLPENPTTGYRWTLEVPDDDCVEVVRSEWHPVSHTQAGGGGEREFHLAIHCPGEFVLALKLWRSWEGEGSVITRRCFTLTAS